MSTTHNFKTIVCDDWGITHPDAIVVVRSYSQSVQETGVDKEGSYDVESKPEAIAYTISFYGSVSLELAGKRSRPIFNDEGGLEFKVDLEHEESLQAQESAMDTREKMFRQIELDVKRRLKAL